MLGRPDVTWVWEGIGHRRSEAAIGGLWSRYRELLAGREGLEPAGRSRGTDGDSVEPSAEVPELAGQRSARVRRVAGLRDSVTGSRTK